MQTDTGGVPLQTGDGPAAPSDPSSRRILREVEFLCSPRFPHVSLIPLFLQPIVESEFLVYFQSNGSSVPIVFGILMLAMTMSMQLFFTSTITWDSLSFIAAAWVLWLLGLLGYGYIRMRVSRRRSAAACVDGGNVSRPAHEGISMDETSPFSPSPERALLYDDAAYQERLCIVLFLGSMVYVLWQYYGKISCSGLTGLTRHQICDTIQFEGSVIILVPFSVFMTPMRFVLFLPLSLFGMICFFCIRPLPGLPQVDHQYLAASLILFVPSTVFCWASVFLVEKRRREEFLLVVQRHLQAMKMGAARARQKELESATLPQPVPASVLLALQNSPFGAKAMLWWCEASATVCTVLLKQGTAWSLLRPALELVEMVRHLHSKLDELALEYSLLAAQLHDSSFHHGQNPLLQSSQSTPSEACFFRKSHSIGDSYHIVSSVARCPGESSTTFVSRSPGTSLFPVSPTGTRTKAVRSIHDHLSSVAPFPGFLERLLSRLPPISKTDGKCEDGFQRVLLLLHLWFASDCQLECQEEVFRPQREEAWYTRNRVHVSDSQVEYHSSPTINTSSPGAGSLSVGCGGDLGLRFGIHVGEVSAYLSSTTGRISFIGAAVQAAAACAAHDSLHASFPDDFAPTVCMTNASMGNSFSACHEIVGGCTCERTHRESVGASTVKVLPLSGSPSQSLGELFSSLWFVSAAENTTVGGSTISVLCLVEAHPPPFVTMRQFDATVGTLPADGSVSSNRSAATVTHPSLPPELPGDHGETSSAEYPPNSGELQNSGSGDSALARAHRRLRSSTSFVLFDFFIVEATEAKYIEAVASRVPSWRAVIWAFVAYFVFSVLVVGIGHLYELTDFASPRCPTVWFVAAAVVSVVGSAGHVLLRKFGSTVIRATRLDVLGYFLVTLLLMVGVFVAPVGNVFGSGRVVWLYILTCLLFIRPPWRRPIVMWLSGEAVVSISFLIEAGLNPYSPIFGHRVSNMYAAALNLLYTLVFRQLWDSQDRKKFVLREEVLVLQEEYDADAKLITSLLEKMAPRGVAQELLHRFWNTMDHPTVGYRATQSVPYLPRPLVLHPHRSTVTTSVSEDMETLWIQLRQVNYCSTQHQQVGGHPDMAALSTFHGICRDVEREVGRVLTMEPHCHAVDMVSCVGDGLLLVGRKSRAPKNRSEDRALAVTRAIVPIVQGLREMLSRHWLSESVEVVLVATSGPCVGALVGTYSCFFEYYGGSLAVSREVAKSQCFSQKEPLDRIRSPTCRHVVVALASDRFVRCLLSAVGGQCGCLDETYYTHRLSFEDPCIEVDLMAKLPFRFFGCAASAYYHTLCIENVS
jgi:hypothetical protein